MAEEDDRFIVADEEAERRTVHMSLTPGQRQALHDSIVARLDDLAPLFDQRCKLTFVMRSPHLPDGDVVVTSDDIDAVIAALERLKMKDPYEGSTQQET